MELGLERGGHLLTAGERVVVGRILTLPPDPARLHALLSARRTHAWPVADLHPPRVADPAGALSVLVDLDLVDHLVPWSTRALRSPRPALVEAARALGLSTSGRREELAARIAPHRGWTGPWVRIRHSGLIRRLEQWALLRAHPDRSILVVERLGHVRWPEYTLTPGPSLFPDRRALLAWERLLAGELDLDAIAAGRHVAPGRLHLGRLLRERLLAHAASLAPTEARSLYERVGTLLGGQVAVKIARALEREGRPDLALDHLRASDEDPIAVARMGRRLAAALRTAWPPPRPLHTPRTRTLRLQPAAQKGHRPLWRVRDRALPVERAVIRTLAALDRHALHAEGSLWATLFALIFAEAYFLPVPGALPVRFLSGPLDLGTPAFRRRPVHEILDAVRRGEAPGRIRAADARWRGVRLAGANWDLTDVETLAQIADGIGGPALADVLDRLVDDGSATRGMPDLVVLPGPPVRIAGAHPSRLPEGLLLAEVKGPGDTVRDAQRIWFDRLLRCGVEVELWEIVGSPDPTPAL